MENLVNIHLQLSTKDGKPLNQMSIHVKLFDSDIIKDDYLGNMILDQEGRGTIKITRSDINSFDSPGERFPDIYFEVFKGDELIFKSKIFQNLHIEESDHQDNEGIHFDLGSFVI